jgi:hypothetical protein
MRRAATTALFLCAATSTGRAQSPFLQQQLAAFQQSAAPGQVAASPLFAGVLQKGQAQSYTVAREGARCYAILGLGGAGVRQLELWLFDPTNRKVEAEKHEGATPQLHYCADWPGNYRVQAQVKQGAGEIVVQAFVVPIAAPPPSSAPPPIVVVRAPRDPLPPGDALAATVDHEASVVAPASRRVGEFLRGVAAGKHGLTDWLVNLEAGKCYTFVGVGGPGVEALYLFLWSPSGRRVGEARPRSQVALMTHCALMTGPHRLEGKTARGEGELRAGVYVQ